MRGLVVAFYIICSTVCVSALSGSNGIKTRSFVFSPKAQADRPPKLVIIGGSPGTGKSTFGMSVALDQGILKCISTDTIRAVMRSFIPQEISPSLHRSSYAPASENDDPVRSWRETCTVLENSVQGLVDDALERGVGLVLEGVSIVPSNHLIKRWEDGGGVAMGCLLTVPNEDIHRNLLLKRGMIAGSGQRAKDDRKMQSFERVRLIQDEMIRLAQESNWIQIEQKVEPDPLETVANKLDKREYQMLGNGKVNEDSLHGLFSHHLNLEASSPSSSRPAPESKKNPSPKAQTGQDHFDNLNLEASSPSHGHHAPETKKNHSANGHSGKDHFNIPS